MSSPSGQPQSLLVVDLRPEHADRMISQVRDYGLAVRATKVDNLDQALALIEKSRPDAVLLSADGPPGWSFETALMGMAKFGIHPVLVSDGIDATLLAKALTLGACCVVPDGSVQAMGLVLRRTLESAGHLDELRLAQANQKETAIREEALLDLSRDPVAYIHEGMHIKANKAYLDFFNIGDAEEVEGLPFLDLVAAPDADRAKEVLKQAGRGDLAGNFEFALVPEGADPVQVRLEFSRASYEGEPCLQVTLRMQQSAPSAAPAPVMISDSTQMDTWDALCEHAGQWWKRVEQMHEQNSAAFVAIARPHALVRVPVDHAHEHERRLWSKALAALKKEFGNRFQDDSFVQLGAGSAGIALPSPDADTAKGDAQKFKKVIDGLDVDVQGGPIKTAFEVSAVALGAALGWRDFNEAKSSINKGFSRMDGGFSWFDPSHEGREELSRQRALFKAVVNACAEKKGLRLQYRPIMPLNASARPLFELVYWLDLEDMGLLGGEDLLHGLMEADCMGDFDAWLCESAAVAVSRLSAKDACVLVPVSATSLKSPSRIIQSAHAASGRMAMQWPANHASSWPEQASQTRQALRSEGFGMAISALGSDQSYQDILRALEPEWACLDPSWSEADQLREKQTQQALSDLVSVAKLAKSQVIAQGVSNPSTMSALFSADVDYAHGDFLSPPMDEMGDGA